VRRRSRSNRRIASSMTIPAGRIEPSPARAAAIAVHVMLVVCAAAVVAGFFLGGRALSRWLRSSESFAVRTIEVGGLERLERTEVLGIAGISAGMSIFAVDEQKAAERLRDHPWIREAIVRKKMPDALSVDIVERELALLLWCGGLYRVDSDGTIFEKHPAGAPVDRVVVTGIEEDLLEGDREILSAELRKIIQVLAEYERMGLGAGTPVSSVHREHGGGLVLYIGDDGREIRLGIGHVRKKLMRLRAVFRKLTSDGLGWEYIMVDSKNFPERVVVKLRPS